MNLRPAQADAITLRVRSVEQRTGAQVVVAVVGKSDAYPEIVWIAFALGASISALAVTALDILRPHWVGANAALSFVAPVLLAGATSALAAVMIPAYARLFLHRSQREAEVRQHAQAMFLDRRLTATRDRIGILLLVSMFERKVELVADLGYDGRVNADQWNGVIGAMTPMLASGQATDALMRGLDALEALLRQRGFTSAAPLDELPNAPIDQAGA